MNGALHQVEVALVDVEAERTAFGQHKGRRQADVDAGNGAGHRAENTVGHEVHRAPASVPALAVVKEAARFHLAAHKTITLRGQVGGRERGEQAERRVDLTVPVFGVAGALRKGGAPVVFTDIAAHVPACRSQT